MVLNTIGLIHDSALVLEYNRMLFYRPFSIISDHLTSWYDATKRVHPWNHQNQTCHEYTSINTKSNDSDPFYMIVSCCVVCGLAKFVRVCHIWTTACVYHGWLSCWYWLAFYRWLTALFLCTFFTSSNQFHSSLLSYDLMRYRPMLHMFDFTNQNVIKSWFVHRKWTQYPSPTDRIRSPVPVDCCVICFHLLLASGVQVLPSEPPKLDTTMHPKKER